MPRLDESTTAIVRELISLKRGTKNTSNYQEDDDLLVQTTGKVPFSSFTQKDLASANPLTPPEYDSPLMKENKSKSGKISKQVGISSAQSSNRCLMRSLR
ncbi:hypothetical protein NE237_032877 [Protea cynaroides]|uniref:Uncharacterized protein n=1 Tax=Protea cynaroides TaxID=273540 RepID=A0A9Q0L4E3_9MAGN|nr:hypothetical protein NE237_032877 [Protea cynaroides]